MGEEAAGGQNQCLKDFSFLVAFTQIIQSPQLLTILVLKFERVQFTTQCCV